MKLSTLLALQTIIFQGCVNAITFNAMNLKEEMNTNKGGLDMFLQIKNPDEGFKKSFAELNIQEAAEYIGNDNHGTFFRVKMKSATEKSNSSSGKTPNIQKKTSLTTGSKVESEKFRVIKIMLDFINNESTDPEIQALEEKYSELGSDLVFESTETFKGDPKRKNLLKYLKNIKNIITGIDENLFYSKNLKEKFVNLAGDFISSAESLPEDDTDTNLLPVFTQENQNAIRQINDEVHQFYLEEVEKLISNEALKKEEEIKKVF